MTTINFQERKLKKTIKFICSICGKKKQRVISESQTINPFNKNIDGTIKSPFEVGKSVSEELAKRLDRFNKEPVCSSCKQYLGY